MIFINFYCTVLGVLSYNYFYFSNCNCCNDNCLTVIVIKIMMMNTAMHGYY